LIDLTTMTCLFVGSMPERRENVEALDLSASAVDDSVDAADVEPQRPKGD